MMMMMMMMMERSILAPPFSFFEERLPFVVQMSLSIRRIGKLHGTDMHPLTEASRPLNFVAERAGRKAVPPFSDMYMRVRACDVQAEAAKRNKAAAASGGGSGSEGVGGDGSGGPDEVVFS
jgi:hypothetical protein